MGHHRDLAFPVHYFGVLDSGRMITEALGAVIRSLPLGVSEVNIHPGLEAWLEDALECSLTDRRFLRRPERVSELSALLDPRVHADLAEARILLARFRDVLALDTVETA